MKTYPVVLAIALLLGDSQAVTVRGKSGSTTTTTTTTTTTLPTDYIGDDGSTVQKPVNQTCDGARERLYNDNKAQVFSRFKAQTTVKQYTDPSFPPSSDVSIYWPAVSSPTTAQWNRPASIWGSTGFNMWGTNDVKPIAVRQGALCDCWWLATMGALAEWPARVKSLFTNYDTARSIYELKMWDLGRPKKVVVDDWLPMASLTDTLYVKRTADKSVWAMILEKAGAKFFGNYNKLNWGNFKSAYYVMTGRPGVDIYTSNFAEDAFFQKIAAHDTQGDVMYASCKNTGCSAVNLVASHAYTVLGARTYTDGAGVTWKLYHLRNPWGSFEYNGTFSDFDTKNMNSVSAAALGHVIGNNDGDFWMTSADYYAYIGPMGVGQYATTDLYTVVDSVWDRSKSQFSLKWTMTNPVQQDVYVGLSTEHNRQFMTDTCVTDQKFKSGEAFYFEVTKGDGSWLTDYWGKDMLYGSGHQGNDWLWFINMPSGTYTIYSAVNWSTSTTGLLKFSVMAWASKQAVTLSQNPA